MKHQIKYALYEPTQRVMYIDKAARGLACNCRCFECKEKLEAVQGDIREWHFRHSNNTNCQGGPETAIHTLAKQIIADNSTIVIPGGNLYYSEPKIEQWLEQYKPDVSVVADGLAVHFEILVTHAVDEGKKLF